MRLIIDGYGKSIRKRDNQIVIKEGKEELNYYLAKNISQILILGKGSVTFDALDLMSENGIDLISIDWKGKIKYKLSSENQKNIKLRKEQYYALNDERSGFLAKSFIKGKIENQKAVLTTQAKSNEENNYIIQQRDKLMDLLDKLDEIEIDKIDNIRNKIFGVEGRASAEYWNGIKYLITNKIEFKLRSGKNAQDPVNSLLNYAYAILQSEILKSINLTGLDSYCGFLHSDMKGRTSLVFDLMEEFRQQIVDKTVLSLINRKQINIENFSYENNKIMIDKKAKFLLIRSIMDKLDNDITFNDEKTTYAKLIENQARNISAFLNGTKTYTPFYLRW